MRELQNRYCTLHQTLHKVVQNENCTNITLIINTMQICALFWVWFAVKLWRTPCIATQRSFLTNYSLYKNIIMNTFIFDKIDKIAPKDGGDFNPIARAQELTDILKYISELPTAIERDTYIDGLSLRLQLNRPGLAAEIERIRNPKPKTDFNEIALTGSLVLIAVSIFTLLIITLFKSL